MVFSSSNQLVYSIHTILLTLCHSVIHSVHQQPEGTGVAYKQLVSQEFNCNPFKQMWCDIQHLGCLPPVICPNFMVLQCDDSFLDNHVCIPLSLINTLTHVGIQSSLSVLSLFILLCMRCEPFVIAHVMWLPCQQVWLTERRSKVHWLNVESPERTLNFA